MPIETKEPTQLGSETFEHAALWGRACMCTGINRLRFGHVAKSLERRKDGHNDGTFNKRVMYLCACLVIRIYCS